MLLDANLAAEVPAELSSDIVIVGAGTVGLYLADALAESKSGSDIIVLEAGSKVASTAPNTLTSISTGRAHAGVHLGRAAGLGGTSSLWGGQLAEFDEADFERHDAAWPLSYAELQRYYQVVYQRLAVGTPASAHVYRQKFGAELEPPGSIERFFTYWLEQPNFAAFYKSLIQSNPRVRVVVNLTANGLELDGANARALSCSAASGRKLRIKSRLFVFASGTVATSRFFLSTRRAGGVPWASSDQIGLYFQDHMGGKIAKVALLNEQRFRDYFENGWVDGIKLQPKLTFSPARRSSLVSGACAAFTFDSSVAENLAHLKRTIRGIRSGLSFSSIRSRFGDVMAVNRSVFPLISRYLSNRRIFALFDQGINLVVQAEQIPIARSKISLQESECAADGLVPVAVIWQCDGRELETIHALAAESAAYLKARGIAELTIDPALWSKDSGFIDRLGDTYHQCGGMRMSASPGTGVVDGECRVWGTNNVWVAGAAVFPSSSHANCTLTALALATRLITRLHAP